jgi:hypothetical protein
MQAVGQSAGSADSNAAALSSTANRRHRERTKGTALHSGHQRGAHDARLHSPNVVRRTDDKVLFCGVISATESARSVGNSRS